MAKDVVYASSDVTVHKSRGFGQTQFGDKQELIDAEVLRQGDYAPLDSLAEYQQEAIKGEGIPGLEVVSEREAKKRSEEVSRLRAAAAGAGVPLAFQTVGLSGPDADDGSFSDHLLSDAERVANHSAFGEANAGEAGTDGDVTVAGAEREDSPAQSGRKTRKTSEVQGSAGQEAATEEKSDSSDKE